MPYIVIDGRRPDIEVKAVLPSLQHSWDRIHLEAVGPEFIAVTMTFRIA